MGERHGRFLTVLAATALLAVIALTCQAPLWAHGNEHTVADATEASPSPLANKLCPVMPDEPVDPNIFVNFEGKRVYFCCARCRNLFMSNPEKYLKNLPQFSAAGADPEVEGAAAQSPKIEHHKQDVEEHHDPENSHGKDSENAHDHTTDHYSVEKSGTVVYFLGKFHPVAVHFPIALIAAAALAELLSFFRRGSFFRDSARFCIFLGAISAVAAATLGWANALYGEHPGMEGVLALHKWLGISTTVLALLAAGTLVLAERSKDSRFQVTYRVILFAAAVLVALTGHFGGALIYGVDYYTGRA